MQFAQYVLSLISCSSERTLTSDSRGMMDFVLKWINTVCDNSIMEVFDRLQSYLLFLSADRRADSLILLTDGSASQWRHERRDMNSTANNTSHNNVNHTYQSQNKLELTELEWHSVECITLLSWINSNPTSNWTIVWIQHHRLRSVKSVWTIWNKPHDFPWTHAEVRSLWSHDEVLLRCSFGFFFL